jgi:glycosyltransferase involved in cell wall biosynthesis
MNNTSNKIVGIVLPRTKYEGYFQLALSIADSLLKYSFKYTYVILYYNEEMLGWLTNRSQLADVVKVEKRTLWQRITTYVNILTHLKLLRMTSGAQTANLMKADIDLLIIPFPGLFGFMNKLPYIMTITSIRGKHYTKPPIGASFRIRLSANIVNKNAAKYAVTNIVDSQEGMDDLNECYDIAKDKITVIPHMPSGYIYNNSNMDTETADRILKNRGLPDAFIFYPAQFLHGKNHLRLVQSLKLIERVHKIHIPAVFVGNPEESFASVTDFVRRSDMTDRITHLGYVSDKEIVALYKKAAALVYPSLFGPTNLPPLEAMILGTPVLCSNLFSMPEQIGEAGLLFDPYSVEDMAEKIVGIWTDKNLRSMLRQKGYERTKDMTQERYARQWETVIDSAFQKTQNSH